ALGFERVNAFRCRNVNPAAKDAVLNLLAVEFDETDAPAGAVTLIFSGGAALRLEVECLECELANLGPSWTAKARPAHEVESDPRGWRFSSKKPLSGDIPPRKGKGGE